MLKSVARKRTQYNNWYDFKRELELNLWCHLENTLWLEIKPKKALPWSDVDMREAVLKILKLES